MFHFEVIRIKFVTLDITRPRGHTTSDRIAFLVVMLRKHSLQLLVYMFESPSLDTKSFAAVSLDDFVYIMILLRLCGDQRLWHSKITRWVHERVLNKTTTHPIGPSCYNTASMYEKSQHRKQPLTNVNGRHSSAWTSLIGTVCVRLKYRFCAQIY